MNILILSALFLFNAAPQACAADKQYIDLRFEHESHVFKKKIEITPGVDVNLSAVPVTADDKGSNVLLNLRASLQSPDASGHPVLLYKLSLVGQADAVLLESQSAVYLSPGTGVTVAQCGGWAIHLSLWSKYPSGQRTGNDTMAIHVESPNAKYQCTMYVKPGGTGTMAVDTIDPNGSPRRSVYKLSPSEAQGYGGTYAIDYDINIPGFAMSGQVAVAPKSKSKWFKSGSTSASIGFGQDN
jgi:hypothetical protein